MSCNLVSIYCFSCWGYRSTFAVVPATSWGIFRPHCTHFYLSMRESTAQAEEVLGGRGRVAYLGCSGFTDSQGFSEVGIHSVVGFTLPFWWLDPLHHAELRNTEGQFTRLALTHTNTHFTESTVTCPQTYMDMTVTPCSYLSNVYMIRMLSSNSVFDGKYCMVKRLINLYGYIHPFSKVSMPVGRNGSYNSRLAHLLFLTIIFAFKIVQAGFCSRIHGEVP